MRRHFITIGLLVLLLAACQRQSPTPPSILRLDPSRQADLSQQELKYRDYNLVFVSFDALQAAHVGCLGYHRNVTPTLDRLAQRGCVFTNVQSVASWTVPSSMSWFTGVYPTEHQLTNKFATFTDEERTPSRLQDLSPQLTTLADALRASGYATAGFTGNAGVSGRFGYAQGFDVYWHEDGRFGGFAASLPRALEWLKTRGKKQKFFLFLHGYDCHAQYPPNGGFDRRFVEKSYDGKYTGAPREHEVLREEGLEHGALTMRDEDVQFWRAIYDERIQRADEQFGRFLAEFDQLGLRENTIFVITSDHGTEYYEHRRVDHGFTLYEEQLHVPLFLMLPDQLASRIVNERVSSLDLMPTLLELLDIDSKQHVRQTLRGVSLIDAMRGDASPRDIISETDYRAYTYQRAIVSPDGWKLIYALESRSRELYDLNHDPHERQSLAEREPSRADAMEERLFTFYRELGHDLRARRWEPGLNPVYDSQIPR